MKVQTSDPGREFLIMTIDSFSMRVNNHPIFIIFFFLGLAYCLDQFFTGGAFTLGPQYFYLGIFWALILLVRNPLKAQLMYTLAMGPQLQVAFSIPLLFTRLFFVDGQLFMPKTRAMANLAHQKLKTFKDLTNG